MNKLIRKKPGSTGEGRYFHVEVRPKENFVLFNTRDVGRPGHSLLVLGKQKDGKWVTHKWLIDKRDAYINTGGQLQSDDPKVQKILEYCGAYFVHKEKDIFQVLPIESERKHQSVQKEKCPEMYFENYDEYENYLAKHTSTC